MMKNIVNSDTQVLVQGITGKEGERVTSFMLKAGTKVVAGVRPGKAGERVHGVPVFDSVGSALKKFPGIKISCVYVPPKYVLEAAKEALENNIPMLHVIAEGVPNRDTAELISTVKQKSTILLGPSSLGLYVPGKLKIGSIGGRTNSSFVKGFVGVISRSGGLSSEVSNILTQKGLGQSSVFHIGGDYLIGTSFSDLLPYYSEDPETRVLLIVGEAGGSYENEFAKALTKAKFSKPVVAYIGGQFIESLPKNVPLGHAGAIIGGDTETRAGKIKALKQAKVSIADKIEDIPKIVKELL